MIDNILIFLCIQFIYLAFCGIFLYFSYGIIFKIVSLVCGSANWIVKWIISPYFELAESIIRDSCNESILVGIITIYLATQILRNIYNYSQAKKNTTQFFYNEECSICIQALSQQYDEYEVLPCHHAFHTSCISIWVMNFKTTSYCIKAGQKATCPICRNPVGEDSNTCLN